MERTSIHSMPSCNRFRPQMELLDDRVVPSCTWVTAGNVLTITGDGKANDIAITDDGTSMTITCDGDSVDVPAEVTAVVIRAGNGDDAVSYSLTGDLAGTRVFDVKLGNGKDVFSGEVAGNLLDGSSLSVESRGCNGKDELGFDVAGGIALDSSLAIWLNGGNGKDLVDAGYAGLLTGDLEVDLLGGNGKDEIASDATFDFGSTGAVDVEVTGWNAPDTLALLVTDNSGVDEDPLTDDASMLSDTSFVVDGGRGPDRVDASETVEVIDGKGKP